MILASRLVWILGSMLLASGARAQSGTCPASMSACLGAAVDFNVIAAESFDARSVRAPFDEDIESSVTASVCAQTMTAASKGYYFTVYEDVLLLAPTRVAARFRAMNVFGEAESSTDIGGNLVTAGGSIVGQEFALVGGVVDTSGTHGDLARCQQALADARSASVTLAGLTPTQVYGRLESRGLTDQVTLTAGPGVNVIAADAISILPENIFGIVRGGVLHIDGDETTESVIINTKRLSLGAQSLVLSGINPFRVVINVTGNHPVKIGRFCEVEVRILALDSKITSQNSYTASLYGERVAIKGADVRHPF